MKNKIIIPAILLIIVSIISFFVLPNKKSKQILDDQIILFYGSTCPHCKIVENYLDQNNISITRKEVYNNHENSKELKEKAKLCGLSTDSIGVPFLWYKNQCILGDQNIINKFNSL